LKTKRIIVLRFDRHPQVCRSRVALLRRLNPGVPICGIFGGGKGYKQAAFRLGGRFFLGLDDFYRSRRGGTWNWRNGDLALAAWYRDVGWRMDFEVAHFIEWDILLLESLERLHAAVPKDAVGLTAFTSISAIERDWQWLKQPDARREWEQLLSYARTTWGYDEVPHACWGAAPSLPRSFLERYAAIDPPELCHDELRLPLFAQILGFPIADTGFRHRWHDREEDRFFNLLPRAIERNAIVDELGKPDGRRVFHPVRFVFNDFQAGIQ
jgi:hypothetical protein